MVSALPRFEMALAEVVSIRNHLQLGIAAMATNEAPGRNPSSDTLQPPSKNVGALHKGWVVSCHRHRIAVLRELVASPEVIPSVWGTVGWQLSCCLMIYCSVLGPGLSSLREQSGPAAYYDHVSS